MKRLAHWIWSKGIVSTFLSGLFALLPIAITVAIAGWVVTRLHAMLGPGTAIGTVLRALGLRFVTDEGVATAVGWAFMLAGIWLLGLLVKSRARHQIERSFQAVVNLIPIVKGVYGTAAQVVGILRREEKAELQSMSVVYCRFGAEAGAGFLALLASPELFRFDGRDCRIVYIPTSPLPMSGGIVIVPSESVTLIDMPAEHLMQIYFSLGTLASSVIPPQHRVTQSVV